MLGGAHQEIVGNGVAWTGNAFAFSPITDCTPTVITVENGTGDFSGKTYAANSFWPMQLSALTIGSGQYAIVYMHKKS